MDKHPLGLGLHTRTGEPGWVCQGEAPASPLSPPDDGGGDEKTSPDVILAKAYYRQRDEIAVLAHRVETLETERSDLWQVVRDRDATYQEAAQRVKTLEEALRTITDPATTADGARSVAQRALAEPTP